jgi:hypothetical protein
MASLTSCPRCGRKAQNNISSNWFPVRTCRKCGTKYCRDCGGSKCPSCGDSAYSEFDKVYAK